VSCPWARRPAPAPSPPAASPAPPEQRGVDFGWKVHDAQEKWTAKVDSKAGLYLATQTAVLVAVFAAWPDDKPLGRLAGANQAVALAGTGVSILAVLLAGCAVIPMLGFFRGNKAKHRDHLIYFGHLRHWRDHNSLSARLRTLTAADELDQLSMQLIAVAKRNWRKHWFLFAAMTSGASGALSILGAYLHTRL
jgi:hypothetical protein